MNVRFNSFNSTPGNNKLNNNNNKVGFGHNPNLFMAELDNFARHSTPDKRAVLGYYAESILKKPVDNGFKTAIVKMAENEKSSPVVRNTLKTIFPSFFKKTVH